MAKKSTDPIVAEVNKNFIIRWKNQDEKKSNLVSAGKYHTIVGFEMKKKHFATVLEGGADIYI